MARRAGDIAVVGVLFDEDGHMAKEGCSRRRIWNTKTSQSHYLRRSRSIVIDAECPGSRAGGSRRELSTQRAARTGSQGGGAGCPGSRVRSRPELSARKMSVLVPIFEKVTNCAELGVHTA